METTPGTATSGLASASARRPSGEPTIAPRAPTDTTTTPTANPVTASPMALCKFNRLRDLVNGHLAKPPKTFIWIPEINSSVCLSDSRRAELQCASPRALCNALVSTTLQGHFVINAQRDISTSRNALVSKNTTLLCFK